MLEPPTHTGVDDVHAHPRHVGHRWIDLVLALTALFISGVSLYVAVDHGRTEQKLVQENARLVQANSWPFLQLDASYSRTSDTHISLVNAGIGPAKLEGFQVLYQGRTVADFRELLRQCCGMPPPGPQRDKQFPRGISISNHADSVLRPGEKEPVMEVHGTLDEHSIADRFLTASNAITYWACYCSVFDQCWISHLAGLKSESVAACPTGIQNFNDKAE